MGYTKAFLNFSGYEGIISMNKETVKIHIGIPLWIGQKYLAFLM